MVTDATDFYLGTGCAPPAAPPRPPCLPARPQAAPLRASCGMNAVCLSVQSVHVHVHHRAVD